MGKLFSFKPVSISDSTILAAQHGDFKAREKVIRDCTSLTTGLIKSIGKSLNTYSSEELTHIGMLVTLDCLDRFRPENGTPFTAYAFSAIRNKFITMINRQKRFVFIDEGWDRDDCDEVKYDFPEYDSEYSRSRMEERENATIRLKHLLKYTSGIKQCERCVLEEMIRLINIGVTPTDEMIAKRLGISHQAVSKSRNKLIAKLRKTDKFLNRTWGLAG